ncbi:MAG: SH3 domain-containing protein [Rhizobiaceae bacterium]
MAFVPFSWRMLVMLALMSALAGATSFGAQAAEPGYYRVEGVAGNDVLNIRAEPDSVSQVIGELLPGVAPVEVLEVVGEWGRVLAADGNGWVSMRFLQPTGIAMIGDTLVPDGLVCGGTEPFWSLKISAGAGLVFEPAAGEGLSLPIAHAGTAIGRNHRFGVTGETDGARMTAMLGNQESCSDGMSDRDHGWRIDLLVEQDSADGRYQQYEGCCGVPVR